MYLLFLLANTFYDKLGVKHNWLFFSELAD